MVEDRPVPRNPAEEELLHYLLGVRALRLKHGAPPNFKYAGFEDYLIQHGTFFEPRELPDGVRPMMLSQCFENCYRVASRTKTLHYVEGVAIGMIPINHAWLVDKDGHVVDPTWTAGKTGIGTAYIGVEFALEEVKKSRRMGVLCLSEDYRRRFPVLTGDDVIASNAWFRR